MNRRDVFLTAPALGAFDEFLRPLRRLTYKMAVTIYSIGIDSETTRSTPELRQAETAVPALMARLKQLTRKYSTA
jgi:hypothetical protein